MCYQHEPSSEQVKEEKLYLEMGLSESEYELVQKYIGRLPNYTETGIFAVLWSEHCSYKNSTPVLKRLPTEGPQVLQGPGEGAGVVDIGEDQAVVFKIESHNSPSAVEPYQGAATGVGGILRDVFSMGATPVAILNSLRLGELDNERNKFLFKEIVAGIAGYGNTIEVPTVGGEVQFDSVYGPNPLVNAMAVGLIDHKKMQKGLAKGVGNSVIYAGAPTGRDGIHGATFSSVELVEDDEEPIAMQVGYPEIGKRLMNACLEVVNYPGLVGIQDMGAAGLTSSSAEMASKAGTGIELNLDNVPQSEENMNAYEMMLSESQERMLLVVEKGKEEKFLDLFKKYDLEAAVIGRVIEEKNLRLIHNGVVRADVSVAALVDDAPVYNRESEEPVYYREFQAMSEITIDVDDVSKTYLNLLKQPTVASKAWVYEQFVDAKEDTVLGPGSNAAVIPVPDSNKGLAITTDGNSRYVYLDPYVGGAIAVAEAARNIVCSGGKPLALTDGLNYGNPYKPDIFWQIERSIDGIADACNALETPVIGGNVSLSNETNGKGIYPTPIIGMVGLVEDRILVTTKDFKQAGDLVYLVGETKAEFGGSELQKLIKGEISGRPPQIDLETEAKAQNQISTAIRAGVVSSAHDLSEGGLAVALVESLANGQYGAELKVQDSLVTALFSESQSRFLVSVPEDKRDEFEDLVNATLLGQVTSEPRLKLSNNQGEGIDLEVESLIKAWKGAIPCLLK